MRFTSLAITSVCLLFTLCGVYTHRLAFAHVDQGVLDDPPSDDEIGFPGGDDEEEDSYRLQDISSDVEVDASELIGLEDDGDECVQPSVIHLQLVS